MTTTEFKLYCFAQSGNAYKAALTLQLCGASWEPRFVDFFNGETRTPAYREKINEMGEVPVLEHRGKRLTQSGVILHYLADHFGKFQGDRLEVLRWMRLSARRRVARAHPQAARLGASVRADAGPSVEELKE